MRRRGELIERSFAHLYDTGGMRRYMLPFMQTVKHDIHFGESHLLIPCIPSK